jgi:uroporphyrinogen-III synthase
MLLITRPLTSAERTKKALAGYNIPAKVLPMLEISYIQQAYQDLHSNQYQSIIFSSQHAAQSTVASGFLSNTTATIICVGSATQKVLLQSGLKNILSADGNWHDLKALVQSNIPPGNKLLYLRGNHVKGRLIEALQEGGYHVEEKIVYQSHAKTSLNVEEVHSIEESKGVSLYSVRTAATFMELCYQHKIDCSKKVIFCLSNDIAEVIKSLDCASVKVSIQPNEKDLIELIVASQG